MASIIASVSVAMETYLLCCCLAVTAITHFTILAFSLIAQCEEIQEVCCNFHCIITIIRETQIIWEMPKTVM
jgi:hypothetical protein